MEKTYRVMIVGEDHTEFCYTNGVTENRLGDVIGEATIDYPEGQITWELEQLYPMDEDGEYDHEADEDF